MTHRNVRRLFTHVFLAVLLVSLAPRPAAAWSAEGHRIAARIAWASLSDVAKTRIRGLLAPGEDLASISSWADEVRPLRKETAVWHYVDIPLNARRDEIGRFCPQQGCVYSKIKDFIAILQDPAAPRDRQAEALKFLVHFVGDMHQPLHCSDNRDRGGNDQKTLYFGKEMNLHYVWDGAILKRMGRSTAYLADTWNSRLTRRQRVQWASGSVEDWAWQSKELARKVAYGDLPKGRVPSLGEKYERQAEPVVQLQLSRAGVRLAMILNEIYKADGH